MDIPLQPEQDKLGETGLALAESNFCAGIKVGPPFGVSMWKDVSPLHWRLEHRDYDSPSPVLRLSGCWSSSSPSPKEKSLGCLSKVSNLAPESHDLLGSKKRKMGQRVQCAMTSRERHADYMQINNIILHGLPKPWMTGWRARAILSNCQPKNVPHALQPSPGRASGRQTGSRQSRASQLGLPLVLWGRAEWKQEGLREQRRPQPRKTLGTGPELWSPALSLRPRG